MQAAGGLLRRQAARVPRPPTRLAQETRTPVENRACRGRGSGGSFLHRRRASDAERTDGKGLRGPRARETPPVRSDRTDRRGLRTPQGGRAGTIRTAGGQDGASTRRRLRTKVDASWPRGRTGGGHERSRRASDRRPPPPSFRPCAASAARRIGQGSRGSAGLRPAASPPARTPPRRCGRRAPGASGPRGPQGGRGRAAFSRPPPWTCRTKPSRHGAGHPPQWRSSAGTRSL